VKKCVSYRDTSVLLYQVLGEECEGMEDCK